MLPIALQLYSIRDEAERDLAGALRRTKAMGYDGVEFAGLYGHTPAEVRALLDKTGLIPISAHVPFADMMADPAGVLSGYKEIGCRYIAVPYLTEEYRMGAEKGAEAVSGIRMLGETAQKLGMTLLYHNHDFEFITINGKYALDILYETIPAELLQTQIDTCWVSAAGVDAAEYLRKYAGRAPVVHLKDYSMEDGDLEGAYELIGIQSDPGKRSGTFEFRPLGFGQMDMPAVLAASQDAGALWYVVEQDLPSMGKSAFDCAEMSIQYLRNL